jgi:phospholipase A1
VILPHRPNYILFGAYNSSRNEEPFKQQFPDDEVKFENWESQFQISVKFPVVLDLFKDNLDLYFAYTNRSFWQVYASDISAPFRETNH